MLNVIIANRDLTPADIENLRAIEIMANELGAKLNTLQGNDKWIGEARSKLQDAFHAIFRAIAQPVTTKE